MGQGSLFGGWEATRLEVSMGFVPNKHSGWVHISTLNEEGQALTSRSVSWRNERDLSGLPQVLRIIGETFLYGTPEDVIWEGARAIAEHMHEVKLEA